MKFAQIVWLVVYFCLLILSLDYWRWGNEIQLTWLGLPQWLIYFVVLHLVLVVAIALHARFPDETLDGEKSD